jgi:uncharacterized protein (DUF2237 family)
VLRSSSDTVMLRDDKIGGGGRRPARNVLGEPLEICSFKPMTGFYRDGRCNTGRDDIGSHTVCAVMTSAFLDFSKSRGNDLSTPVHEFGFPGLKPGDRGCLCAARRQEALEANHVPRLVLHATHESALSYCSLTDLKELSVTAFHSNGMRLLFAANHWSNVKSSGSSDLENSTLRAPAYGFSNS